MSRSLEDRGKSPPVKINLHRRGNLRIGVVLKGLLADPLDELLATLYRGPAVSGRVVRAGAVRGVRRSLPGSRGLIHISAMAERHITHPREILTLGQVITSTVIASIAIGGASACLWSKRRVAQAAWQRR